MFKFVNRSIA